MLWQDAEASPYDSPAYRQGRSGLWIPAPSHPIPLTSRGRLLHDTEYCRSGFRGTGLHPGEYAPAVQDRPAEPYPNTNIVLLYTHCADLSTGSLLGGQHGEKFVQFVRKLRVSEMKFGNFPPGGDRRRLRDQVQEAHGAAPAEQSEEKP